MHPCVANTVLAPLSGRAFNLGVLHAGPGLDHAPLVLSSHPMWAPHVLGMYVQDTSYQGISDAVGLAVPGGSAGAGASCEMLSAAMDSGPHWVKAYLELPRAPLQMSTPPQFFQL